MQFYDATTKQGICQEIDRLCDTSDTDYPRIDKTSRVNNAKEQVVGWLINADGTWEFDDSNYTDLPIGTQTLIASQSAYTFNDKFLQLKEVQVKDINGNWTILKPIDQVDIAGNIPLDELYDTDGLPICYDKVSEDTIKLYPAPDAGISVTLASGLKVKFKRTAKLFTVATGVTADTTVPGFPSPYHPILAYMASIPYCMTYKKDRVGLYEKRVMDMKKELLKLYALREKDVKNIITTSPVRGGRWR